MLHNSARMFELLTYHISDSNVKLLCRNDVWLIYADEQLAWIQFLTVVAP